MQRWSLLMPLTAAVLALAGSPACRPKPEEPEPPKTGESESASKASDSTSHADEPADPAKPAEAQKPANSDPAGDGTQIIHTKNKDGTPADIEVRPPPGWQVMTPPSSPDPHGGKFTLQEALKGLKGRGDLVATIATSMGEMHCDLYEDKTPNTVANFVGLARGLRKFWDGREWAARPYYDGLTFHRVIPGFMIQGGDLAGDGSGRVWYQIPDEVVPSLHHDRGGLLCMANRGPNTNEAQFFIMEAPAPHLDGSYTIFGACKPTEIVYRIARVPQDPSNNRPLSPVRIERISIARVEGGANAFPVSESDTSAPLPKNTVPGVAPPGRVVRGDKPPPQQ